MYSPTIEWMASWIGLVFTGVADTTSTLIEWDGGGRWVAKKYCTKPFSTLKTAKWCSLVLHMSHKVAISIVKLITQSCGEFTTSCPLVKERGSHLRTNVALTDIWKASEASQSKSSLGNLQHQYLPQLLINVYSYRLMKKSVSCCCVKSSHILGHLLRCINLIAICSCWFPLLSTSVLNDNN